MKGLRLSLLDASGLPAYRGGGILAERLLKCEPGGEEAMCEITKSFVEEGVVKGTKEVAV